VWSEKSNKELTLKVFKIINDYSMYLESSYMKIVNRYMLLYIKIVLSIIQI
jgi:hypothetical protein